MNLTPCRTVARNTACLGTSHQCKACTIRPHGAQGYTASSKCLYQFEADAAVGQLRAAIAEAGDWGTCFRVCRLLLG